VGETSVAARAAIVALLVLAAVGCAPRRPIVLDPQAPAIGVYRARLERTGERPRRFRLLLWAARPDRLHAEILSPLGTTELILDAGAGRLAVTVVDEAVAYEGPASADALERTVGIGVEGTALVAALLDGAPPGGGVTVDRRGGAPGRLPARASFVTATERLFLDLERRVAPSSAASELGTGEPPPGVDRQPLERLPALLPG
jgi:hypothetical protein